MMKESAPSAARLKAAQQELEYLKTVRRKEIAVELKMARSSGDLCGNEAYERARDAQFQLEERIAELEHTVMEASIVRI